MLELSAPEYSTFILGQHDAEHQFGSVKSFNGIGFEKKYDIVLYRDGNQRGSGPFLSTPAILKCRILPA
jgi:hypothetical protein